MSLLLLGDVETVAVVVAVVVGVAVVTVAKVTHDVALFDCNLAYSVLLQKGIPARKVCCCCCCCYSAVVVVAANCCCCCC